jgi:hypothetical protein
MPRDQYVIEGEGGAYPTEIHPELECQDGFPDQGHLWG